MRHIKSALEYIQVAFLVFGVQLTAVAVASNADTWLFVVAGGFLGAYHLLARRDRWMPPFPTKPSPRIHLTVSTDDSRAISEQLRRSYQRSRDI